MEQQQAGYTDFNRAGQMVNNAGYQQSPQQQLNALLAATALRQQSPGVGMGIPPGSQMLSAPSPQQQQQQQLRQQLQQQQQHLRMQQAQQMDQAMQRHQLDQAMHRQQLQHMIDELAPSPAYAATMAQLQSQSLSGASNVPHEVQRAMMERAQQQQQLQQQQLQQQQLQQQQQRQALQQQMQPDMVRAGMGAQSFGGGPAGMMSNQQPAADPLTERLLRLQQSGVADQVQLTQRLVQQQQQQQQQQLLQQQRRPPVSAAAPTFQNIPQQLVQPFASTPEMQAREYQQLLARQFQQQQQPQPLPVQPSGGAPIYGMPGLASRSVHPATSAPAGPAFGGYAPSAVTSSPGAVGSNQAPMRMGMAAAPAPISALPLPTQPNQAAPIAPDSLAAAPVIPSMPLDLPAHGPVISADVPAPMHTAQVPAAADPAVDPTVPMPM